MKEEDKEYECGLRNLWFWTPENDALFMACKKHDQRYLKQDKSWIASDFEFVKEAWTISRAIPDGNKRRWAKFRTIACYGTLVLGGWVPWYLRKLGLRK